MKHFRLLLTLFALILGWTNVGAQSWQAYEVGEGVFYLYNVGTGQYFTKGNDYGTRASITTGSEIAALNAALKLTLESYNENYKLRTDVNASGYGVENLDGGNVYTDQSRNKNSTWTFTKVADASNGPVYTIISAENHDGGAGSYLTASADNTIVGPAAEVTDDYGRWQLLQSWITNNMPVSDANGWTVSQTPTFDSGNVCAEFWNKSGASIKQTVSNLPAGNYELIAVALTRDDMTATLNAGTNTMSIATVSNTVVNGRGEANTWFNAGNGVNRLEFTHAGGNLEIGLTADNTTGDHWLVWRSFVLLYKGVDLTALKEALQAQIDEVPALEGTTTAAAYNAAKNYSDGIDMDALTTEEEISTASTELANLVNAAKALQAPYSRYRTLKAAVDALDDDTSAFTGEATVNTTDADGAVEAATSLGDIEYAITLLRADAVTFLNAIVVNEGKSIDITDIWAVNPGFEEGNTNGWTNSGSIEANAQGNKAFDNTQGNYYAERWHTDGTVNLSQTITGLPAGSYVISAYLYTDTPDGVLFANASKTNFNTSNNYSVNVEVDDNGSIIFGASCTLTTSTWICMDDFKIALAGVDHSRYNSVKEAVLAIANDLDITQAEALNASAKKTEDIENAVKALRTALLTYLPNAEIPEIGYIDLTNALIDNPTVRQNTDYWTAEGTPNTSYSWGVVNYEECEFYYQNFDFYQTLTLCNGTYEFGVTGFHRAGNHATYFYAGEDKVLIPGVESSAVDNMAEAKTYFDNGNGKVALKFALEGESNDIKIGIINNDTETDRWTIFRDFTLKYFGATIDLTPYKEALAAAVTAAEAVNGTVPTAVYNTLAAVVAEQNKEYSTKEAYVNATTTIEEAIATAKAMQDPYNRYNIVKAAVIAISETISTSEADAQAEAATTTEALDAAVVTLRTSLLSYLPTAVVAEGEFIDLTNAMVDNPTVRQNTSYWTIEGTPNGTNSWGKVANEECEFYQQNFDFYQTLTLSKGTYEFGVTGFHRAGNHATYFYAGEDKILIPGVANDVVNTMAAAKEYFDAGNGKVALKFALENESNTLKIGILNNDTETDKWTIFRDFTLKYYGSQVDLSSYEEAWNEAVAAAEAAIAANPNVTGEELTAVNTAKADVPEQTKESYMTKTEALANATAALVAAAPSYNLYSEKKAFVDNFEALPYADPAKKPTTEGTEAPANAQEAVAKANAFMQALRPYVESNALAEGVEGAVNLTSKIKQDAIADWTAEITGSNATFVLKNADGTDPDTYTAADGTNGRNLIDSGDLWGASSWTAKMTQSVKLTPGKYIITASARGSNDLTTFKLLADDKSVDMEHFGAAEGSGIFNHGFNDYYIEFELTEVKDVVIGFEAATEAAHNWCSVARFRLARIEDRAVYATDAELTALTEALQPTAKLGFEKDDYAPYNNVESLTTAEAEIEKVYAEMEVFGGKATQATVLSATQVISQLNWTANTAEVNAFFDGSFASEYSHEGNVMPIGWHGVGDKDNATNVRLMWNVENNAGLNAASNKQAAFAKFTAEYGTEVGYTLPLKAGVYDLKFIYGGWNEVGTRDIKVYNTENDAVVTPVTITAKDNQAHTTADSWSNYEGTVTIPADGNYVFSFYRENTTNQNQLVFSDITLYKAKAKKGDVNGDTKVDIADITALVNALQKSETPAAGKIDGDDDVDAADVEALVNMILENNE